MSHLAKLDKSLWSHWLWLHSPGTQNTSMMGCVFLPAHSEPTASYSVLLLHVTALLHKRLFFCISSWPRAVPLTFLCLCEHPGQLPCPFCPVNQILPGCASDAAFHNWHCSSLRQEERKRFLFCFFSKQRVCPCHVQIKLFLKMKNLQVVPVLPSS